MEPLRPAQVDACKAVLAGSGTLLWGDVGTGKTRVAIAAGHLCLCRGEVPRCVVLVSRASLLQSFKVELTKFYSLAEDERREVLRELLTDEESETLVGAAWDAGAMPVLPRAGALGEDRYSPGSLQQWNVITIQSVYASFASQLPPPFVHTRSYDGRKQFAVHPGHSSRVSAGRWWREMCAEAIVSVRASGSHCSRPRYSLIKSLRTSAFSGASSNADCSVLLASASAPAATSARASRNMSGTRLAASVYSMRRRNTAAASAG